MYNVSMLKSVRNFLGILILLSLLLVNPAQAQESDSDFRFFDQTKHNVKGDFWAYYQGIENAEVLLGYPITDEFINAEGVLVQYFQRARLEMKDGIVILSPLGEFLHTSGVQLRIHNPLACRLYDSGFSVCFAFLEFFDAYGGADFFGEPISPFEFEDNKIVQYFQNGRMEWHPSRAEGERVVMGDLGLPYFEKMGEDAKLLDDVDPPNRGVQVVELNVQVFLSKAVADATDEQLIYVVVRDQTGKLVENVNVEATVLWTTRETVTLYEMTGDSGLATLVLPVENQIYGESVAIDIKVSYGTVEAESSTSFRIWY